MAVRAWRIVGLAGLAAAAVLYLVHAALFRHYINDDAFITFRYSRFLAAGLGPYFNPAEHVEGYTNLLLMLLLAPAIGLGGEGAALPCAKGIGILGGVTGVLLGAAIGMSLVRTDRDSRGPAGWLAGILAAGLLAATPFYALNSVSGLETTLYGALLAAGVLLALEAERRDRWRGAGAAFALAAWSRPEGAAVFGAFSLARAAVHSFRSADRPDPMPLVARLRADRGIRRIVLDGTIVLVAVAAQILFRRAAYDGEWLPNTYWAKAGGFWSAAWPYVRGGAAEPFLGLWATLAGLLGLVFLPPRTGRVTLPVLVAALAGALSPLVTGADWMPGFRLVVPYLPLLAALVAAGWVRIGLLALRRPAWLPCALLVLVPVAWVAQGAEREGLRRVTEIRARGYANGHTALARWLREGAARPGDTVALMDIGIVGYLCKEQTILDVSGLTDRFIAKSPGSFLDKRFDPRYVLDRRPELIVATLSGRGAAGAQPAALSISPWTPIEAEILSHPEFARHYARAFPPDASAEPSTVALASRLGAVRVFVHDYPGKQYLLAVYRRRAGSG